MVKPGKGGPVRRRLATVSIYALSWLLLTVSVPVWVALGLLIGLLRRRAFIILRLLVFAWFYFGFELIALLLVGGVFLSRPAGEARSEALYRLQAWWGLWCNRPRPGRSNGSRIRPDTAPRRRIRC